MREQFMNWPKSETDGEISLELLLPQRTHKHQECLGLLSFPLCQSCPKRHGQKAHRCSDLSASQEITVVKRRSINGVVKA